MRRLLHSSPLPPLVVVVGPTASGKTELAVRIAKKFDGEIINADPWQMYRGLNIGTSKPKLKLKNPPPRRGRQKSKSDKKVFIYKGVPHHCFDIATPKRPVTVQGWKKRALPIIDTIHRRNKIPILVGGSEFYIRTLLENLLIPEVPPQPALRTRLERTLKRRGLRALAQELLKKDPASEAFVDLKNPRRVIRALEVMYVTKKPFSRQRKRGPKLFTTLMLAPRVSWQTLKKNISARVTHQIRQGLEQEVTRLTAQYGWTRVLSGAIATKEWKDYFSGKITRDQVARDIAIHNIKLAKKQARWFRVNPNVHWVRSFREASRSVKQFLENE